MRRISHPGNEAADRASVLIDAVFAIAILCIGIAVAAFALGSITVRAAGCLDSTIAAIQERGSHETKLFGSR
jgi:hypothetical protein